MTEKSLYIFTSDLLTEKETEKIVRCYFLSDLLLISEIIEKNEILLKSLYLDEDSFAQKLPKGNIIQNLFKVQGKNGALMFYTDEEETSDQIITTIN